MASLCEEADRPNAGGGGGSAGDPSGEALACRRAVLGALASQVGEVVAGLTARQASTPKLRFADTAARFDCLPSFPFSVFGRDLGVFLSTSTSLPFTCFC